MVSITSSSASVERQLVDGLDAASPWAAILEHAGLAVAILNRDFAFQRVSSLYAVANGQTPEFFPGRNYFEIFPQTGTEVIFRRVRDSGIAETGTGRPCPPDRGATGVIAQGTWSLTPFADSTQPCNTRYLVLTLPLARATLGTTSATHATAAGCDQVESQCSQANRT